MAILEVQCLEKIYTTRFGGNQVRALTNVSFSVEHGEYVAIMGESGSGKTTLLNILAALDKPTKGDIFLEGKPLSLIKEKELSSFRRDNLGFVFQDFNLLDTFSLKDNIFLPLVLSGKNYKDMNNRLNQLQLNLELNSFWKSILMKFPEDKNKERQLHEQLLPIPNCFLPTSLPALLIHAQQTVCLKFSAT